MAVTDYVGAFGEGSLPEAVAQDDGLAVGVAFIGVLEEAAEFGADAEGAVVVPGNELGKDVLAMTACLERDFDGLLNEDVFEGVCPGFEEAAVEVREVVLGMLLGRLRSRRTSRWGHGQGGAAGGACLRR